MKVFLKDTFIVVLGGGAMVGNIILWGVALFVVRPSDVPFTLHYTVLRGVDLIGEYQDLYTIPMVSSLVFLMNSVVSLFLYERGARHLSYIVLGGTVLVAVLLGMALSALILINFS